MHLFRKFKMQWNGSVPGMMYMKINDIMPESMR